MGLLDVLKPNNVFKDEDGDEARDEVVSEAQAEEKVVRSFPKFRGGNKAFDSDMELDTDNFASVDYDSDIFVNKSVNVKICKPKSYESVESIGQAIKDKKVVILHMDKLDPNVATRILEFVYGMCFYAGIEPENVDSKIIMIDPQHKRRM